MSDGFAACRCSWYVMGGLFAGRSDPEYSRLFTITADEWGALNDEGRVLLFHERKDAALAYAADLMNPGLLNWVNVEWVWL